MLQRRKSKAALETEGLQFSDYEGMKTDMADGPDCDRHPSHWETEKLIDFYKPDIFCAGIKEKYVVQKMGIPLKQLHSYDYGGPYAGFKGAVNFYKEIDRMVNSQVWQYMRAPWQEHPELSATYAWE